MATAEFEIHRVYFWRRDPKCVSEGTHFLCDLYGNSIFHMDEEDKAEWLRELRKRMAESAPQAAALIPDETAAGKEFGTRQAAK